jgi:hypothetical protein
MKPEIAQNEPVLFSPNLRADDKLANYWLRQATLRLRREISWMWYERGSGGQMRPGELPPIIDKASSSLDLSRYWSEKQDFFSSDVAARYLTQRLQEVRPDAKASPRGSVGWVINELDLNDVSSFVLALGLAAAFDGSFGAVIATCLNDTLRVHPNLALVQRLWDRPEEVLSISDPIHPLFAFGLLRTASEAQRQYADTSWEQPLTVPSLIARKLLDKADVVAAGLVPLDFAKEEKCEISKTGEFIALRLRTEKPNKIRVVPLIGNRRSSYRQTAIDVARTAKNKLFEFLGDPKLLEQEEYLAMLITFCWLADRSLFIGYEIFGDSDSRADLRDIPLKSVLVTLFVSVSDRRQVAHLDPEIVLPLVSIPTLTYQDRLDVWKAEFGTRAQNLMPILKEMSRRFRYEKRTIRTICGQLKRLPKPPTEDDFIAACRAELSLDIGDLAAYIEPRFINEQLILPNKQAIQFEEQIAAMQSLTKVHYDWGTAGAWNEGGITLLFAGPPGTGKTMAAEIMAQRLKLPMYRVDLSQVVNKYIGETEKNLKKIFDAADISDIVLFFDEADSLFGKRTDVNDARDRYANLEVSYLLERMERFKGLAILATNRKGDLDQAFARRIRYVMDFPVPDEPQRAVMWKQMIPASVTENSQIDIAFLARQFPLSGGNIRSIVFNACLQSAHNANGRKELYMKDVLIAVKREYDKMDRSLGAEHLGPYGKDIAELD